MKDNYPNHLKESNMLLSVGMCICWMTTFSLVSSLTHEKVKGDPAGSETDITGFAIHAEKNTQNYELEQDFSDTGYDEFSEEKRSKRTIAGTVGQYIIKGITAAKELLTGAKPLFSISSNKRVFVKKGDYSKAVKDFYSVRPTSVRNFKSAGEVKGKMGQVGDRIITIEQQGEKTGKPTMEIIRGLSTTEERVDTIVYVP